MANTWLKDKFCFSWDNMESTDHCSLLLKIDWHCSFKLFPTMHIIRLEAYILCACKICSYHKATSLTRLFLVWYSLCGNVNPDHFVLMHREIPRKFIFMFCKHVQQIILFTSNVTSRPSSAGFSTICFTFQLLMVTSLFSVTFAMRDTVVADIYFNHVFRHDPESRLWIE